MRVDTLRKIRKKIRSGALREFYHEALWVWGYIRRYRLAVGIYILLGLLSTLMGLGTSVASKYLIDAVTGYKTGTIGAAAAAMAGMLVLGIVLRSVSSLVGAKNSVYIRNEIQAEIYGAVLNTAWEPLEDYRPGDLLSRLTSDVDTVSASVTSFAPGLISGLAQFFGALIIMFYFDPTMALIALIAVPVSALLSRVLVGRMRQHNRKMKAISSDVMSFYEDSLTNITSIKAFHITGLFFEKMRGLQQRYQKEFLRLQPVFRAHVDFPVSGGNGGVGWMLWLGCISAVERRDYLWLADHVFAAGIFAQLVLFCLDWTGGVRNLHFYLGRASYGGGTAAGGALRRYAAAGGAQPCGSILRTCGVFLSEWGDGTTGRLLFGNAGGTGRVNRTLRRGKDHHAAAAVGADSSAAGNRRAGLRRKLLSVICGNPQCLCLCAPGKQHVCRDGRENCF